MAIIRDKSRSATIICKEDCDFAIIKAEEFRNIFNVVERRKLDEKLNFFKLFLMKKISDNELVKLVYAFQKRIFMRNEILFEEGQLATHVYFIKKGEVQVLFALF